MHQHTHNKFDYFSYTPELYNFLATSSFCSFKVNDSDRTQIELMQYAKDGQRFFISANRFAYFYNEYCTKAGMPVEQFAAELRSISDKAYEDRWEVDHANDNKENNCPWGLSLIPSRKNGNGGKGSLLKDIKPPYFCFIAVMPEGDYRLKFGYLAPTKGSEVIAGQEWFIHCKTIDKLNDFLRSVYRNFVPMDQLPTYLLNWGNPQYLRMTGKDQELYFAGNFETEALAAEQLLAMDAAKFIEWDETVKWTV